MLQRHLQRGNQPDLPGMLCQQDGLCGFRHRVAHPYSRHAVPLHIVPRVHQSSPALVHRMVLGQIEMGETMGAQRLQPFRLSPEHELLHHRRFKRGGRAFQIPHHHVGTAEHRIRPRIEDALNAVTFNLLTHSPIKKYVARKGNRQRIPARRPHRLRLTDLKGDQHRKRKNPKSLINQHSIFTELVPLTWPFKEFV